MTPDHDDVGKIGQLWAWVTGGFMALCAWVWSMTMGRISKLEQDKLSRIEFSEYVERTDQSRQELAQNVKAIADGVNGLAIAIAKIEVKLDYGRPHQDAD